MNDRIEEVTNERLMWIASCFIEGVEYGYTPEDIIEELVNRFQNTITELTDIKQYVNNANA